MTGFFQKVEPLLLPGGNMMGVSVIFMQSLRIRS